MGQHVNLTQESLDILVCPVCKTAVKYTEDKTALRCATCKRVYPVRDDIPAMLAEEATIEKE